MASLLTGNKFDPDKDVPDLSGKVYAVTGGSAGIGFGIVAHMLQHNAARIFILSKKEEHAEEAQEELKKWGDASRVEWKKCDLEDLHQTDEVAKELSKLDRLDALVCNAGLGVGVYNETKDGLDSHMQVNHFSHFHLSMTLLPLLQKTPNARLVVQSSDLHRGISDVKFESVAEMNQDIGPTMLYNRTKVAQILFIRKLVQLANKGELGFDKSQTTGPWMNATHPGGVKTDQQKQAVDAYGTIGKIGANLVKPFMKDAFSEGCRPALFAATSEDVVKERIQGKYIVPDRKVSEPSNVAQSDELAENLWKLSFQVLQDKLGSLPYRSS